MECNEDKIVDDSDPEFESYLENEKKKLRAEFDQQRAKMKELYLQKEVELTQKGEENTRLKEQVDSLKKDLDEMKSQLVVADLRLESNLEVDRRKAEELASWQKILYETVEQSSSSKSIFDSEIGRLQAYIQELQRQISDLKAEKLKFIMNQQNLNSQESSSLAPSVVLSAVTKKIVKKLDAFSTQDSAEDVKDQEEVEVLKSLYSALEEEMKVLKDKLRSTDEKLQKCKQCGHFPDQQEQESNASVDLQMVNNHGAVANNEASKGICDMCRNYELELVKEQETVQQLEAKVVAAEKAAEKSRDDLLKEIGFRKEMEEKWNEKREEHKIQVAELNTKTNCAEQDLKELRQIFQQTCDEINKNLARLTAEREQIQDELNKLQRENNYLVGKYTESSEQLQDQIINLPDTVEELHELVLKKHEDLIIAKIAKEAAEENANMLRSEIAVLNDRIQEEQLINENITQQYSKELDTFKRQKMVIEKESALNMKKCESALNKNALLEEKLEEQNKKVVQLSEEKRMVETALSELKLRTSVLQQELDVSEGVQKDFVLLSQHLQVQLEKIRAADSEVRWQYEEDVDDCQGCKASFSPARKKQHCKHCGHIFCANCLSHTVLGGPNERPSKVCDVCHTLLVKTSAPYFSTEVPHTPD